MTEPYGTPPMFTEIPELPVAPFNDTTGGHGKITYTRYRVKEPVRCDDCMAAFITNPSAPASRVAAYKRAQAGTNSLLLCYAHTRARKDAEAS